MNPVPSPPERVTEMLERALSFTEKLLAENARLRRALATSHAGGPDAGAVASRLVQLEGDLAATRAELDRARASSRGESPAAGQDARRITELEREAAEDRERCRALEEQNNRLANLYTASFQLHSTLDFKEVVSIVMEIVVNLIGAESFALMLVDGKTDTLHAVAAEAVQGEIAPVAVGDGTVGAAVRSGESWFAPEGAPRSPEAGPLAVIPLRIKDQVIGALVLYRLLPQKQGALTPVDHELFSLLAGHAATALFASKLHGESERKLSTIQGFLDLLTTT